MEVGVSLPGVGELALLLVKLIWLPSFVTSKSLILVLSLGNKNQWDIGLEGRVYVDVPPVLLKSKKKVNGLFSSMQSQLADFPISNRSVKASAFIGAHLLILIK